MTREAMIKVLRYKAEHIKTKIKPQFFTEVADALKQQPCKDCISRQAVLEYIEGSDAELGHSSENESVCQDIKEFPPVTPIRKTGHWIPSHIPESILDECSECGFSCGAFTFNYCPRCGAKMIDVSDINVGKLSEIPAGSDSQESKKINCKSAKCENCINHNYCDFEQQESGDKE